MAATAGYPHITVPMGTVHGLPIGFSFMAGAYKEAEIIAMAYAFEQASKRRVKPTEHDLRDALDAILAGKRVSQEITKSIGCFISKTVAKNNLTE